MVLHINKQHKRLILLAAFFLGLATPLIAQGGYSQNNMAAPNTLTLPLSSLSVSREL